MNAKQMPLFLDSTAAQVSGDILSLPPTSAPAKPRGDAKLALRLHKMADRMTAKIEAMRQPMTQNPTPKRMRQRAGKLHAAANMERTQRALYVLAMLHESGTVPNILAPLRTKSAIESLVWTRGDSPSFYEYFDTMVYSNESDVGKTLQALISGTSAEQEEAVRLQNLERLEAKATLSVGRIPSFFPTPATIAEEMVFAAGIVPGMTVLEPSAGAGGIADVIRRLVPKANIGVIERNASLRELLKAKGYDVLPYTDFLEHHVTQNGVDGWRRIVMNPPFENFADIDHVRHAYKCLKAGGRLVAVMCERAFFSHTKKAVAFREWLLVENAGYILRKLEMGELESSGAAARIVVIDK